MKKFFGLRRNLFSAAFLVAILCVSGCSKTVNTSSASGKKYDTVVFALMSFNNIPGDVTKVENAVNKITEPEIGVDIKLKLYGPANYAQQVSLAMTGGAQLDVFHSLGDFSRIVSKGQAYDITDIVDACAPDAKNVLGEKFIKTGYKDGKLYGLPAYKSYVLQPQFIYRRDIADKLGLDLTGVKTMYDLTPVLEKVKAAYPQMNPFAPIEQGNTGIPYSDVDYLTDDMRSPKGVLVGDVANVENFYNTDEFKKSCDLMREWNRKSLISKDAASSTSIANETFGRIVALSSALIIHDIAGISAGFKDPVADYNYYHAVFGDLNHLVESSNNPETLLDMLLHNKKELPEIFMACGTEDFLIKENRAFHDFLNSRNIIHDYFESAGVHNWKFWDEYIGKAVTWLMK
ncbi:MAG TPA: hypothetical protein DCL73_05365 [Treponema sp.]|nr:hypothetical protein [Treponema sp.]